jgi:hypothetical protein
MGRRNRVSLPVVGAPPHTATLVLSYDSESLGQSSLSTHLLIALLTGADIIESRVRASLRDRLRWCGLQGLGWSV